MPKYRRGFKKETNEYSREFRKELGLNFCDPLSPWDLAEYLGIRIIPLSQFRKILPNEVQHLYSVDVSAFSATTVFDGNRRLIIHNDGHHPRRRASNIAHELAHGILGHPPTPAFDKNGCRYLNREVEDEANWFGPALLISEEAAIYIVENEIPIDAAVEMYGVSSKIINMRIGVTGARKRVARRKRSWRTLRAG